MKFKRMSFYILHVCFIYKKSKIFSPPKVYFLPLGSHIAPVENERTRVIALEIGTEVSAKI